MFTRLPNVVMPAGPSATGLPKHAAHRPAPAVRRVIRSEFGPTMAPGQHAAAQKSATRPEWDAARRSAGSMPSMDGSRVTGGDTRKRPRRGRRLSGGPVRDSFVPDRGRAGRRGMRPSRPSGALPKGVWQARLAGSQGRGWRLLTEPGDVRPAAAELAQGVNRGVTLCGFMLPHPRRPAQRRDCGSHRLGGDGARHLLPVPRHLRLGPSSPQPCPPPTSRARGR